MPLDFFLVFLGTVLVVRLFLYLHPTPSPTLFHLRTHHYMTGALLGIIGLYSKNLFVFAVGLGLFVDELTYLLMGGRTQHDNYSTVSLAGTVIFVIVVFFLRDNIAQFAQAGL